MNAGDDAAQAMDGIYRRQRYVYDATRKYYLLGRDRLLAELDPPDGGSVLEIGCGTGRNLIQAAKRYPSARFYGFDISEEMLKTARQSIAHAGLAEMIQVEQGNAVTFSGAEVFGKESFERVFVSYAVSMIPPWREALQQAWAAVTPGGSLHVVDFGGQTGWPGWFKGALQTWLAKFSVTPRDGLESELRALATKSGAEIMFSRPVRDYAQYAVLRKPGGR